MKHFKTYLLCLGLALTTASCSQDDFDSTEATSEKLVEMSFIAGSSQPVTRTVLGSDGSTVTWQTNDKIGIGFKGNQPKNYPFTTPTAGSDVRFWGTAPDVNNVSYFMMYPYQQDAKISANSNTQAIYEYNFPKEQNAIAGTFDPKANVSVGIIPKRGKPFIAYNVGGLLRFTIKGTSDVKQVKLLAVGQENLAGTINSTITFANDGKISAAQNKFTAASPVVNLKAESGTLEENKSYYIALPEQKLSQGLTLVFIMQDGKAILKKVKQEINIQRAKVYDLGEMTLDASKAKPFILKNQGLIEAVGAKISGLIRTAEGNMDIYAADNLEKILSYKGMLEVNNKDNFTSIDELQYYRNINGLNLQGNKNLAGELNLNKYPQLTGQIVISGSPLVTKINVTGLDKITQLQAHHLDGMTEVVTGGNTKLNLFAVYNNNSLQSVDASNMPALTTLQTYYSPNIQTINTTNSPNLNDFNGLSNGSLQNFIGLSDKSKLQRFWASGSKIESYDFSKMTNLRDVNLASAAVKEIKGLSAAGANLKELQLSNTHVGSLDVSNNPNLTKLDLYNVREMTTVDVTHNPNLTYLRTTFLPLTTLDLSNNTKLVELSIAHNKLSSLDIRHMTNLAKFYAGSQSPNGSLANITVTMTAAQKAKLEQVKPFLESANDDRANKDDTNSWVKVVVAP
jgi:leucine rich repeat protein